MDIADYKGQDGVTAGWQIHNFLCTGRLYQLERKIHIISLLHYLSIHSLFFQHKAKMPVLLTISCIRRKDVTAIPLQMLCTIYLTHGWGPAWEIYSLCICAD